MNKIPIEINVNCLIALCHIINDYREFSRDLSSFISSNYNRDNVHNLDKISKGKFVFGARRVKRFYQRNKNVIDTINKYFSISDFITFNYDSKGNLKDGDLDVLYQYILQHRSDLERIISLLNRIKELGFDRLEFDESLDFTEEKYSMRARFSANSDITYVDNIQVIPNFESNVVLYRTTGSNYRIIVRPLFPSDHEFSKYERRIAVNSLLFDPERLPDVISKESIFDRIIGLREEHREACKTIRNAVNLWVSVDDLSSQFDSTFRVIDGLEGMENKDELRQLLLGIKGYLDKLQAARIKCDDSIVDGDSGVTKEILQGERELYLRRRHWENLDLD